MSQTKAQLVSVEGGVGNGTTALPSLTGDDTDTGLSFGTNEVSVSTSGSERFRFGSAGQLGIGGATYGTSGQALISGGSSAAPSWGTAGKILQVVQGTKTDTSSFSVSSQGQWNDVLSTAITPIAANSNILIMWYTSVGVATVNQRGTARILRDSTAVGVADAAGSRIQGAFGSTMVTDYTNYTIPLSQNFMDDPTYTLTDTITYKLQVSYEQSAGTVYINRGGSDSDANTFHRGSTFMQLLEIAA